MTPLMASILFVYNFLFLENIKCYDDVTGTKLSKNPHLKIFFNFDQEYLMILVVFMINYVHLIRDLMLWLGYSCRQSEGYPTQEVSNLK